MGIGALACLTATLALIVEYLARPAKPSPFTLRSLFARSLFILIIVVAIWLLTAFAYGPWQAIGAVVGLLARNEHPLVPVEPCEKPVKPDVSLPDASLAPHANGEASEAKQPACAPFQCRPTVHTASAGWAPISLGLRTIHAGIPETLQQAFSAILHGCEREPNIPSIISHKKNIELLPRDGQVF